MTWTNALGLCPRCEAPVEAGQLVCPRCGLDLVVPAYLAGTVPPELDTTWGYPAILATMFTVCATLYRGFKRNGWL